MLRNGPYPKLLLASQAKKEYSFSRAFEAFGWHKG
jgi:hypothetical protein